MLEIIGSLLGGVLCSSKTVQDGLSDVQREIGHRVTDRFPANHDAARAVIRAAAIALDKLAESEARAYDIASSPEEQQALQTFQRKLKNWTATWRKASNENLEGDAIQALLSGVSSTLLLNAPGPVSQAERLAARDAAILAVRNVLIEAVNPPQPFLDRFDGNGDRRSFFSAFAEYVAVALKTDENFRNIFLPTQIEDIRAGVTELLGYERRRDAAEAKDAGIEWIDDILSPTGVSKNRPSAMVLARHRLMPFLDFDDRFANLKTWATSSEKHTSEAVRSVAGRLYVGDGGVGKTRLAIELADELDERGWEIARISIGAEPNQIWRSFNNTSQPKGSLVIFDYVEAKQDALKAIAKEASKLSQKNGPPIRILALSRSAHGWWEDAFSHEGMDVFTQFPVNIGKASTALNSGGREVLYTGAVNAFRPKLETFGMVEGDIKSVDLSQERYGSPIAIAFAAYLSARGVTVSSNINLISEMLNEEKKAWRRYVASLNATVDETRLATIERGIAQMTLVQGADDSLAGALLERDSYFGERTPAQIAQVIQDLKAFYPAESGGPNAVGVVEPDILGEALIAQHVTPTVDDSLMIDSLIACSGRVAFAEKCPAILQLLIRGAAQHPYETTRDAFYALLKQLTYAVENGAFENSAIVTMSANLPEHSTSLRAFSVAVGTQALELASYEEERARLLNNLGNRHAALGNRETAMEVTQEAVDLFRTLAGENPDAFNTDLAMSLNNLGTCHSELGNHEAALETTQEAVDLYRTLAGKNPDALTLDLASSLSNLGAHYKNLDNREAALETTKEAVDILRTLAGKNPDAFNPHLAMSLNNLGVHHSDLGEREAAMEATQEAVDIRRTLAGKNPDAFNPNLASSLNNLGVHHSGLDDREAAIEATQEAVDLYRTLAGKNPDAFNPDLARTLGYSGVCYQALGDWDAAINAHLEAARILGPYFNAYPEAFNGLFFQNATDLIKADLVNGMTDSDIKTQLGELGVPEEFAETLIEDAKQNDLSPPPA